MKTLLEDNYEDVGLSHRRKKKKNVTDEVRNPFKSKRPTKLWNN